MLYRATTPEHTFHFQQDVSEFEEVQISYRQGGLEILKWYKDGILPQGMRLDGEYAFIRLTQKETRSLRAKIPLTVQVRALTQGGTVGATAKFAIEVEDVNNEEVLGNE